MDVRYRTHFVFLALATAISSAGCGYNQQARFQMSFLPPAPHSPAIELPEPPPVEPNLYLTAADPSVVTGTATIPRRRTPADGTIQQAERAFQTVAACTRPRTWTRHARNSIALSI